MRNYPLSQRILLAALEAALVIGVLYFLGHRDWVFMGSIAAAIVVSTIAPPRISGIVSGASMLALAGFFYMHYHWTKIPTVIGIFGAVLLIAGIMRLKPHGR